MNREELAQAMIDGRAFKIMSSFVFAAQIPDDSVGCSGSRCSNCEGSTAYCEQFCRNCGLPFVGPSGFPQWTEWQNYEPEKRKGLVTKVFFYTDRGRLGYANVAYVPLGEQELCEVEKLSGHEATLFAETHSVEPRNLRNILLS